LTTPDAERLRLYEQVAEFLCAVAETVPYALYVNDLHWARAGTVGLLSHIARTVSFREREGKRVPLAIVGSFRNDEVEGRSIEGLLKSSAECESFDLVVLPPLESADVKRLLCSMLGVEGLPGAFVDRVAHETLGNPFFIEEVMRSLVWQGSVYIEGGQWATSEAIDKLDIPASMTAAFLRRASMLDATVRRILDTMAVHGEPVTLELLEEVSGHQSEALLGALPISSYTVSRIRS
jgi:predicted ATPase